MRDATDPVASVHASGHRDAVVPIARAVSTSAKSMASEVSVVFAVLFLLIFLLVWLLSIVVLSGRARGKGLVPCGACATKISPRAWSHSQ